MRPTWIAAAAAALLALAPPAQAEKCPTTITTPRYTMSPTTMDGTPNRMSTTKPTAEPIFPLMVPGRATSRMKSAVRIPSGAAMSVAMPIRMSVPTSAFEIPPA